MTDQNSQRLKKSLPNGTDISNLKIDLALASQICKIINTCARSNVRVFKLKDIEIHFGPPPIPDQIISAVDPILAEQVGKTITEEADKQTRFAAIQQDVEELRLSDPLAYEQLISGDAEGIGAT